MLLALWFDFWNWGGNDTHDFASADAYRKHLKQRQRILEELEAQKRQEAANLRRQIEQAFHPEEDEAPSTPLSEARREITDIAPKAIESYRLNYAALENELRGLEERIRQAVIEYKAFEQEQRRLRDEEDISVILHALSIK